MQCFKNLRIFSKRIIIIWCIPILFINNIYGQKYFTKDAKVSFYSKAPLENIEAHNYKGACIIEQTTGKVTFSVLMKGFEFAKGLMQDHFNENYVESDKFPKATFTGVINGKLPLTFQDGNQVWETEGSLLLHGINRPLKTTVQVSISNGIVQVQSSFKLNITEFGIKIPSVVAEKVSETVQVIIAPVKLQKL
jgi:hypothetical protein